jgi:hypothetical protein
MDDRALPVRRADLQALFFLQTDVDRLAFDVESAIGNLDYGMRRLIPPPLRKRIADMGKSLLFPYLVNLRGPGVA